MLLCHWGTVGVCGSTISATRPVPVAYLYDYRTISVKPMARGGTARVTHPNVI